MYCAIPTTLPDLGLPLGIFGFGGSSSLLPTMLYCKRRSVMSGCTAPVSPVRDKMQSKQQVMVRQRNRIAKGSVQRSAHLCGISTLTPSASGAAAARKARTRPFPEHERLSQAASGLGLDATSRCTLAGQGHTQVQSPATGPTRAEIILALPILGVRNAELLRAPSTRPTPSTV